jgi:hypothetical protein
MILTKLIPPIIPPITPPIILHGITNAAVIGIPIINKIEVVTE